MPSYTIKFKIPDLYTNQFETFADSKQEALSKFFDWYEENKLFDIGFPQIISAKEDK